MTFRESLPDGCPPYDALEIHKPQVVFRLVETNPPTEEDFKSQRAMHPQREFQGIEECQVRGLSVRDTLRSTRIALKLPGLRGKMICRVILDMGAGFIKQTGNDPHHYTWWPLSTYGILDHCVVETHENNLVQ